MKLLATAFLALFAAVADAHTVMQRISVNDVEQCNLVGVRAPFSNVPTYATHDIDNPVMACNRNHTSEFVPDVINVPSGARIGTFWWGHVIDLNEKEGFLGDPITEGHWGVMTYWLAKTDNATTADANALDWFKIGEDGLAGGRWAVERLKDNKGWASVELPSCLAAGNYLLRAEIIALQVAYNADTGGGQFYMSCAQINVVEGGSWTGSNHVKFPGAYTLAEIDVDIYTRPDDDSTPLPDNGGRPFVVPGGPVQTCPQVGAVNATSTSTSPFTKIASNIVCPTKPAPDPSTGAELGGRCGGGGWEGPFHCKEGTCKPLNFYQWFCTLDEE